MARIYPSWTQINNLRTPLTPGEKFLAEFLDNFLPPSWNIYVQPYINNMRPDIVVLNPKIGMVIFEVKDWNLDNFHFEGDKLIGFDGIRRWIETDPSEIAVLYSQGIFEQFIVSDEAILDNGFNFNNFALSRPAVYYHKAPQNKIAELYRDRGHCLLIGNDALIKDNLKDIVPNNSIVESKFIREKQIEALLKFHSWLCPPEHAKSQWTTTKLTKNQNKFAQNSSGFRRIRGVAGSGKSLILSHRAANLNSKDRNILVVCFNITMGHMLRDLLNQAPFEKKREKITCKHFHSFFNEQATEAGFKNSEIKILAEAIANHKCSQSYIPPKYDGIYIDEGQDFQYEWLDFLALFLNPGGEFVLFADHKQDIYKRSGGNDSGQLQKFSQLKFGRWATLPQKTYRVPERISKFLNDFAEKAGIGDSDDLKIKSFPDIGNKELSLDVFAWKNIDHLDGNLQSEISNAFKCLENPNPGDVVILVENHELGLMILNLLKEKYKQIVHVFGDDGPDGRESKMRKHAFWMGRGGLKMCTTHSFKGWELTNIIVIISPNNKLENKEQLFYTAISRALRNIVVINANRQFDQFSVGWEPVE